MSNRWKLRNSDYINVDKEFILFEDSELDFQIIEEIKPKKKELVSEEKTEQVTEQVEKKKSGRPKK